MSKTTTIYQVMETFENVVEQLVRAIDDFRWEDQFSYANWLAQTYYLVRHTTRFINLTSGGMSLEQEHFHQFLLKHLKEETGHESMALQDLQEGLGWSLRDTPERIESTLMLQSQYYWISKSPFAHFGFFWVLETLSVERGPQVIERVKKAHGSQSYLFLSHHVDADSTHAKTIKQKVEQIPAECRWQLQQNIEQTGHLYITMLREIGNSKAAKKYAA